MFKKIAMFAASLLFAGAALAGSPASVKNATGTATYGTSYIQSIEKDTTSGNQVKVRYPGSTQMVADDASWSVYAKLKAGMILPVNAPASNTGLAFDLTNVYVHCEVNKSVITSPINSAETVFLDNCAMNQAALQNSQ